MKTKLLTICLLLVNSQVFAGCHDDLDISWNYMQRDIDVPYIKWTIKNKTKSPITIVDVGLYANDNETVMKEERVNAFIKPFGKKEIMMFVIDYNLDVAGYAFTSCRYGK